MKRGRKIRLGFIEIEFRRRDANDPTRQAWDRWAEAKEDLKTEVIEALRPLVEPILNWLMHILDLV